MTLFRISILLGLITTVACSRPYRKQTMGSSPVVLAQGDPGKTVTIAGVDLEEKHDRLRISYQVATPRAMELHFMLRCPGEERAGTMGETWEQYRERRVAELEQERQKEVKAKADIIGAVVGGAQAHGQVGPVHGDASASVDGQAVAEQTTAAVVLPAWDVGPQQLRSTIEVRGGQAGRCSMSLWSEKAEQDLGGVTGSIKIVQLVNKARVKREQQAIVDARALTFRADLRASLIARGADPEHREKLRRVEIQKQRAAEAARLEIVAAQRREQAARVQVVVAPPPVSAEVVEARRQKQLRLNAALQTRARLVGSCRGNGADPGYRARQRQDAFNRQQKQERAQQHEVAAQHAREVEYQKILQMRLQLDLRTRTQLVANLVANGADPEYRRKRNEAEFQAFEVRAQGQRRAVVQGHTSSPDPFQAEASVEIHTNIPPRPAPRAQSRPAPPSSQSTWIAGFYQWQSGVWIWIPGIWSTPPVDGAIWIPPVDVNLGGKLIVQPGSWRTRSGKRVRVRIGL